MLVYKYRGGALDRDLRSLSESYLWAASIESLNDPCEAMFENNIPNEFNLMMSFLKKLTPALDNNAGKELFKQIEIFAATKNNIGIFSLSKTFSHPLLWAHYADSHRGFCIEYELDTIQQKLNNFGKHYHIEVNYSNSPRALTFNHLTNIINKQSEFLQTMFGNKPSDWDYEKEIRLITDQFGVHYHDYRAVRSIYFGSRMPTEDKHRIMETLKGRKIKYYQMHIPNNSYKLEARPEADIFPDTPLYKYNIAPVQEDAASLYGVRDEFIPFASYLQKAIEIQRREPYCEEVCYASFSIDKSKPGAPIIFVQYKYDKDGYMNAYYSISEIDAKYSSYQRHTIRVVERPVPIRTFRHTYLYLRS